MEYLYLIRLAFHNSLNSFSKWEETVPVNGRKKPLAKNEAVIIEFVGPPGAGKTTSCRQFTAILQDNDIRVFTLQNLKDHVREMSFMAKLYLLLQTLFLKAPLLLKYTGSLAQSGIYSINSVYRYLRLLIFEQALSKVVKAQNIDIVLLDQWTIQELWSATIFRRCHYNKLPARLNKFYFKTDYVLYFDIDLPTASERIRLRESNLSRFDRMEPAKRLKELTKYSSYLTNLFEKSGCNNKYIFSTLQSPFSNALTFMQHLGPTVNKTIES